MAKCPQADSQQTMHFLHNVQKGLGRKGETEG